MPFSIKVLACFFVALLVGGCAPGRQPMTGSLTIIPATMSDRDALNKLRQRPLVVPQIDPKDGCPVSQTKALGQHTIYGDGPLYAVGVGPSIRYGASGPVGGWWTVKVLWASSSEYRGPALIRGRQLNGPNELRFEGGADPASELIFTTEIAGHGDTNGDYPPGWRELPSFTRIKTPGCYAWQVDGLTFQELIVFQATM